MTPSLTVNRLDPFGADVDVDLRDHLDADRQQDLRDLWRQHHLLVFRAQQLTLDEQARAVGCLGPVATGPGDTAYVSNVMEGGALGDMALAYHSDLSFCPTPFLGGALHAVDVVDGATSTRFANGILTLHDLPRDLRARIEDRRARHELGQHRRTGQPTAAAIENRPSAEHPVILVHPETGEEILYVNEGQTERILDLPPEESEALLLELFAHLYDPRHVYEHHWHNGDLVVYDNLALQHARDDLTGKGPRTLQRVTIAKKGFLELYPDFRTGQSGPQQMADRY